MVGAGQSQRNKMTIANKDQLNWERVSCRRTKFKRPRNVIISSPSKFKEAHFAELDNKWHTVSTTRKASVPPQEWQ